MSCYSNEPYAAKEFPEARSACGIFNEANFHDDYSYLMDIDGEYAGFFLMGRDSENTPWELGMLLVLPEYRNRGLGTIALSKIESFVGESDSKTIFSTPYSPRSILNGIPAFSPDVLHFFTSRGYAVDKRAEGLYCLDSGCFNYDKEEMARRIFVNESKGYQIKNVLAGSEDYKAICLKAAVLCEKENKDGWEKVFSRPSPQKEHSGITAILHDDALVGICAYGLEPSSSSVWGWGNQWGPLLVDSGHRSCGLGGWLIVSSLELMLGKGVREVVLWTSVGEKPSRMYEKYGFRLRCPFYSIKKTINAEVANEH